MVRDEAGAAPFVGRRRELDWLEERLATARRGNPQLVLVSGEAGIGKSRLVRELQRSATGLGMDVCSSRCRELLDLPYLPFAVSLFPRLERLAREDIAVRGHATVLARLLGGESGEASEPDLMPERETARMFLAVSASTIRLAQNRPLLLVVDDLQWADRASIDLLTHVVLDAADTGLREVLPILIVATHRPDVDLRLGGDLARLRREEICHELALGPLDADETGELVRALGLRDSTRRVEEGVHRVAGGNPLFIENVVSRIAQSAPGAASRDAVARGAADHLLHLLPREITAAAAERFADLDESARDILTVAAFLGDVVTSARASAVAGISEPRADAHLEKAWRHGLLERDDDGYQFAHPLYARLAYSRPGPAERRLLHLRIADALETDDADDAKLLERARHLIEAGEDADPARLLVTARRAGDLAWTLLAWSEAARCYEAAGAAAEQAGAPVASIGELYYRAGLAHYRNMDPTPSRAALARAELAYREAGDTRGVALALTESTRAQITASRFGTSVDLTALEEAFAALDDRDPVLEALLLSQMADALLVQGELDAGRELAARAVAVGEPAGAHEGCTRALVALAVMDWLGLRLDDALAHLQDATIHAEAAPDPWFAALPLARVALTKLWLGAVGEARAVALEAADRADNGGDIADRSLALAALVAIATATGDFPEAERRADEAWLASRLARYGWAPPLFLPALAAARTWRGAYGPAESVIDKLEPEPDDPPLYAEAAWVARQWVRAHADQRAEVEAAFAAHPERLAARWPVGIGTVGRFAALADLAERLDADFALDRVDRALERASAHGMVVTDGPPFLVSRVRGIVAKRLGRPDIAVVRLREALDTADGIGLRPELARASLDLARLELDAGETRTATEHAERARALFDEMDMPAFEREAATLFATRGEAAPPESPAPVTPDAAVILFTDIAGSTALAEQLGDRAYRSLAASCETALRRAVRDCGGDDIEGVTLGDGILAVFSSAYGAIECATRAHERAWESGFRLHVGIHAGDVLRAGKRVHGGAVNIAARICAQAEAGETLVSETVCGLARTSTRVELADRGLHQLKGVSDPHRLFAVAARRPAPTREETH